jgi:tetratricopeptide (TPR) repeat protein
VVSLERIRDLIQDGRFEDVYRLLAGDPALPENEEAARLLALACMRMGKYGEAADYYELVAKKSNDPEDFFNLAMARIMAEDVVHGVVAIEEAKRRWTKGKMTIPMMLFHVIGALLDRGFYDAAKRYLEELAAVYVASGRTDDAFLFAQDLPYFGWFVNAVIRAYKGSFSEKAGVAWLQTLAPRLDGEGQRKVAAAVRLLTAGQNRRPND